MLHIVTMGKGFFKIKQGFGRQNVWPLICKGTITPYNRAFINTLKHGQVFTNTNRTLRIIEPSLSLILFQCWNQWCFFIPDTICRNLLPESKMFDESLGTLIFPKMFSTEIILFYRFQLNLGIWIQSNSIQFSFHAMSSKWNLIFTKSTQFFHC